MADFVLQSFTPPAGGSVDFVLQEIGGATVPVVDAGADVSGHTVDTLFSRTAIEDDGGSAITARAWTVQAGPAEVGNTISTAALLEWTPTVAGAYTLRYSATNAVGTGTDDLNFSAGSDNVLDFFMIGGQSNAVYTNGDPALAPNPAAGTAYNYTGTALESLDDKGGFAPAFAVAYYNATGRRVVFANEAVGASAQQYLANTLNHWSEAPTPNRYTFALDRWQDAVTELEALGYTVNLRGLIWDQGGRDAIQLMNGEPGVTADEYETQLVAMLARLRVTFGATFPVWIVRLGRRSTGDVPEWEAIRDKQDAVVAADPLTYFIHEDAATWDASMYADIHHYTQAGYNEIGTTGGAFVAATLAAGDVTVVPAPASLTFTGFAPTVTAGSGTAVSVTPAAASLAFTGFAPSVDTGEEVVPDPVTHSRGLRFTRTIRPGVRV